MCCWTRSQKSGGRCCTVSDIDAVFDRQPVDEVEDRRRVEVSMRAAEFWTYCRMLQVEDVVAVDQSGCN